MLAMVAYKSFILLALATLSGCIADPNGRIIGGADAAPGQFPYQISLRKQHLHKCGGSIISEKYLLTAAHCVVQTGVKLFTIRAGSNNRIAGGVLHNVKRITVHQGYLIFWNDFALLELEEPLVYTDRIRPIELLTEEVPAGSDIKISGWGLQTNKGVSLPILLQYNTLEAISKANCASKIGFYFNWVLCLAHPKDNGACGGDSGGPAVYNGKLAGISNFVVKDCGTSRPDGYSKVSYNVEWIRQHMI